MADHDTHNLPRRRALQVMAAGALGAARPLRAQPAVYSVAVVPQFPVANLHRDWLPLLERLGKTLGITLKLQLVSGIPRFESDLLAGSPDFAYLNPYHQVMAHRAQGYLPLVHERALLTGILVVRRDDPIRSVQELQGRELAFPAPNAFGASLWMRALLAEREKVQIVPTYVQTHSNVYRQVIRGKAAAGGGVNHTLQQERDEVRADLRILLETPGVPPHPLSAHPRVDAGLQVAMTEAVLALAKEPAGAALLRAIEMPQPVAANHARDYRPLESYKLEKYVVTSRAA